MSDEMVPLCKCGDPLPSSPKVGEVLICPHCNRRYRGLGEGRVEAVSDVKTSVDEDGAEVMRFDDKGSTVKVNLREKRRQAEKRRSVAQARASGQTIPDPVARPSADRPKPVRKKHEIPGGVMPMLIFIIAFNAACFIALALLFPNKDGFIQTPWGSKFAKPSIPWPEMLTLLMGHLLGFCGWALYVHRLHVKQKEAKAREREAQEAGEDEDLREETA